MPCKCRCSRPQAAWASYQGRRIRRFGYKDNGTYKAESVCTGVFLNVFRQVSTRHPCRNNLEWSGGDTEEGDNIWVFQAFPHHSLPVEGLRVSSGMVGMEVTASTVYLCGFLGTIFGVDPNAFDNNL